MSTRNSLLALLALTAATCSGQLTPEQRAFEFQNLASMYARRYAPIEWKKAAIGIDILDLRPWLDRVRQAKDDIEYHEIAAEYVASFQDTHTGYSAPSNFRADLGIAVDIYDGKVLIESINRARYPASVFPFSTGDELVSLDGRSADEWIAELGKYDAMANPRADRRIAADAITFRSQSSYPRAAFVGDKAIVEILRPSGELETYELTWTKSGIPNLGAPSVPSLQTATRQARTGAQQPWERFFAESWNWTAPHSRLMDGTTQDGDGNELPRRYLLGFGSRSPIFQVPADFITRLGRFGTDFHFSGTYEAEGLRIGYLRIPSFSPSNQAAAIRELENEIEYFEANTDGMVLDVTRNPGGGCYMLDVARRVMASEFWFFGEHVRVTWSRIVSTRSALDTARVLQAEAWVIETLENQLAELTRAYESGALLTEPLPACTMYQTLGAVFENQPAAIHYSKPFIVLIDDFSTSAADIFPAMIQDNKRAPLVGMRTNGAGGSVSSFAIGTFTEATASNTNSLVVRRDIVPNVTEFPESRFVENVGVRPDIEIDNMTRDNLTQGWRPWFAAFTDTLVQHVRTSQPQ